MPIEPKKEKEAKHQTSEWNIEQKSSSGPSRVERDKAALPEASFSPLEAAPVCTESGGVLMVQSVLFLVKYTPQHHSPPLTIYIR